MNVATYGSLLAISEIGIGTIAHSFRIPFTGHLLSLNQLFILNLALWQQEIIEKSDDLICITHVAAAAKAVTPSYKKITPLIALYAQTLLFYGPVVLLRGTLAGKITGCILSSLWAVVQGITSLYLVFGSFLLLGINALSFLNISPHIALMILGIMIFIKIGVSISLIFITKHMTPQQLVGYQNILAKIAAPTQRSAVAATKQPHLRQAILDLLSPAFLLPLCFIFLGLWVQGSSFDELLYFSVRSTAAAFLLSLASRSFLSPLIKNWIGKGQN